MSLISIIVPVYNVEKYLSRCIESILNQTYKNFELILINDGSTDSSKEICQKYSYLDERIILINKENGGQGDARNCGLEIMKGQFLLFVDSDDYIKNNTLEVLMDKMKNTNADIILFDMIRIINEEEILCEILKHETILTHNEAMELILGDYIGSQPWNKFFKKEMFDNVRFPKKRKYEDIATIYKAFYKANHIVYVNEYLYYYYLHNNSTSFSFDPLKNYHIFLGFKERLNFCQKLYPSQYERCLFLAINFALGTYNVFSYDKSGKITNDIADEVYEFICSNFTSAISNKYFSLSRKIMLIGVRLNKYIYSMLIKVMKIGGN